ncbi:MAG: type I-B CRISPR-associated protein Cas7/Cst2/DevR [Clostridium sp.]|uniref:type I-B CRISPR-associated protein Cas7/Cst2/DevR n=1 Tax=Clostridium sp. TaxID=1506 RepID=UPI0030238272
MSKSITCSIIFQAQSLNYGEGIGNISELKKVTRGDGNYYSLATRQAIAYDFRRLGEEIFGWNLNTVDKSKGTIQFRSDCSIEDSAEMDLLGYMKTEKKGDDSKGGSSIRTAVARLSNAISLEPYKSDMDFLSNKGLADRIGEFPNLASSEQHLSFYTYTVTIDLDRVGVDGEIKLPNEERAKRVCQFLDLVKILNRNIRGRQENLSPLFIIGGMYDIANPFFLGRVKLDINKGKYEINTDMLNSALEMTILDCNVKENSKIGIVPNTFRNEDEIKSCVEQASSVEVFFKVLKSQVNSYYGV